jgi:hypothetical protein
MANPRRPQSFEGVDWAATHTSAFCAQHLARMPRPGCFCELKFAASPGVGEPNEFLGLFQKFRKLQKKFTSVPWKGQVDLSTVTSYIGW